MNQPTQSPVHVKAIARERHIVPIRVVVQLGRIST